VTPKVGISKYMCITTEYDKSEKIAVNGICDNSAKLEMKWQEQAHTKSDFNFSNFSILVVII
jgi:hypothetical protein